MPAVPVLRNSAALVVVVARLSAPIHAQEGAPGQAEIPSQPGSLRIIKELSVAITGNSNVIVGTETRSKNDPIRDTIGNFSAAVGLFKSIPSQGNVSVLYRYTFVNHDQTPILRTRSHSLSASAEKIFGQKGTLRLEASFAVFDFYKFGELSFAEYRLNAGLKRFTDLGLIYEMQVRFRGKGFLNEVSNTVGYTLVDSRRFEAETRLKYWQTRSLRLGLRANLAREAWSATESAYLQFLSGLGAGEGRHDLTHSLQPEATWVPAESWALTLSYQLQRSISNSDYYSFWGHSAIFQTTLQIGDRTLVFAEGSYGVFDYPRRHFDSRYQNTKEDFRTSLSVRFEHRLADYLSFEAKFTHFSNDSNDSIDYDPRTSLTYSSFTQDVFTLGLRFDLTDVELL